MILVQNRQKNNLRHRKGSRKAAVSSICSAAIALTGRNAPDNTRPFPCWFFGDIEIALSRPNESIFPGRWTLDIWTPEKKVLNVNWSPNNVLDLEIVSFRRGDWERFLKDAVSS